MADDRELRVAAEDYRQAVLTNDERAFLEVSWERGFADFQSVRECLDWAAIHVQEITEAGFTSDERLVVFSDGDREFSLFATKGEDGWHLAPSCPTSGRGS